MIKNLEEIKEEADIAIQELIDISEEEGLDIKILASFIDRNLALTKDLCDTLSLMEQRIDIISKEI